MAGYRIALIIAGIDQTYQCAILRGIEKAAASCSVNVEAFVSSIGSLDNPRHDTGEFNIFTLPDFSRYDGAILLTNTIDNPPVVNDILTRIKEAEIPAVSMDYDIPGLYHIGIDNKKAMRTVTEHLITKHGCRTFSYISGPEDNPESADRLASFLETLKEHDIDIDRNEIYYGDFRAPSGRSAAEYLLRTWKKLPDAVICANDVMAASAVSRFAEAGYKVPDDISVTGFDNTYDSHNYQVELTSVERPLEESGRLACQILADHFANEPRKRSTILEMHPHFTESCGCRSDRVQDISEYKELNYRNYSKFEQSQSYLSLFNRLSCALLGCNTYEQYIAVMKKLVTDINPEEFYFCLCDNWDIGKEDNGSSYMESEIPRSYTEEMIAAISYKQGVFYDEERLSTKDVLPGAARSPKSGRFYYIFPLHFGERCLGYMAILNPTISVHSPMFETLSISISNSLENLRKLMCLDSSVRRLEVLYTIDTFTGIYNRNGFVKATAEEYEKCQNERLSIMLMFIDLDGLKSINDSHGHDVGDRAIRDIADVLKNSCTDGEIFCRFGGDEFVVFGAGYTEEKALDLTRRIQGNITAINNESDDPFELSASTGYIIETPDQHEDIFGFVTDADKVMYRAKRKKKLSRYLKSN